VVFDENTFLASDKVFSASLPCARESTPILGKSTSPSPFIFTPLISHVSCIPLQNQIALIKIPLLGPAYFWWQRDLNNKMVLIFHISPVVKSSNIWVVFAIVVHFD
jgi:hypothetical protein